MYEISILTGPGLAVLLLFLGVATPRHIGFPGNSTRQGPIISRSDERRICAELCMSGLGGEPCGQDCFDLMPPEFSVNNNPQYVKDDDRNDRHESEDTSRTTRQSTCPVLCANRLGYPLCNCNLTAPDWRSQYFNVNFYQICSNYCIQYNYQLYGCEPCTQYIGQKMKPSANLYEASMRGINWTEWCAEKCKENDGGAACNCDLLPMMAHA